MEYSDNTALLETLTSPVRDIQADIDIYNAAGVNTYSYSSTDFIKNFTINKVGDTSKFFGFGVTTSIKLTLTDKNRLVTVNDTDSLQVFFKVNGQRFYSSPMLYVSEAVRDENTNDVNITAYDLIYTKAGAHTLAELELENYSAVSLLISIADFLGVAPGGLDVQAMEDIFIYVFDTGANYDGTETLREVLDDLAEVFKAVYFMDNSDNLVFYVPLNSIDKVFTVTPDMYFSLKTGKKHTLDTLSYTTELGDNLSASLGLADGVTQYIRNNPFYETYEDKATLVNQAFENCAGLYADEIISCEWRGLTNLEIMDKLAFIGKDGTEYITYLINDTLTYDGGLKESTSWTFTEDSEESASNATSLGEVLKQTYAKVDKANKQITLLASETSANSESIANIIIDTDKITQSVQAVQNSIDSVTGAVEEVTSKVETIITPEEMEIAIKKEIDNGVDKVTTKTGFTFNEDGLTVSKTDKEMKTTISEDGMIVYKNEEAVLTADNVGVKALNLHAVTYLIVGNTSRFEDYGSNRTGCFWIGG